MDILEKLGDWNPQLVREIKGRLKLFPVLATTVISILIQSVIYLVQLGQIPGQEYRMHEKYCGLGKFYRDQLLDLNNVYDKLQKSFSHYSSKKYFDSAKIEQIRTQLKEVKAREASLNERLYKDLCPNNQIDMVSWWHDHWGYIYQALSVILIITLLVAGTYLLINNLAQEERRGTLNFIRLSPQSEASVLIGKMLGVPILLYLFVALTIPFHIFAGQTAGFSGTRIFSYYIVLISSSIFFFSASFLFALVTSFFSGFQPWLGAGAILLFLTYTFSTSYYSNYLNNGAAWFRIFSPFDITGYLMNYFYQDSYNNVGDKYQEVQFFYIPIGRSLITFVGVHLANYGLWTYGIWQGLKRRFRNPNTSVISKLQSYWLVAFVQVLMWGFTLQKTTNQYPQGHLAKSLQPYYDVNTQIIYNLPVFALFNFVLFLGLVFILSPERQTVQDWSRYRHQSEYNRKGRWTNLMLGDLLMGEKSPALLTIGLHLLMMITPIVIWVILSLKLNIHNNNAINWLINDIGRAKTILGFALLAVLSMIGATVVQRMLMLKTSKRYLWALGIVSGLMLAPAAILAILNTTIGKKSVLWIFSIYPWEGLAFTSIPFVLVALLTETIVLVFLNVRLVKQINIAGESATQAKIKS
ncbi:MAG: ABC transporter permease [Calothrix sp. C42_A2020_038]|nr:ABC transporter permease [Calothrix sp. C42_A2020_038]